MSRIEFFSIAKNHEIVAYHACKTDPIPGVRSGGLSSFDRRFDKRLAHKRKSKMKSKIRERTKSKSRSKSAR